MAGLGVNHINEPTLPANDTRPSLQLAARKPNGKDSRLDDMLDGSAMADSGRDRIEVIANNTEGLFARETISDGVIQRDSHPDGDAMPRSDLGSILVEEENSLASGQKGTSESTSSTAEDLQDVRYGRIDLLAPWFPNVDPEHRTFKSRRSRRRFILLTALLTSSTVLLANLVTLIILKVKYKADQTLVPIFEGSCAVVKHLDIFIHIGINILSTALLGASNLCMQLLAAPTRKELDAAHARQTWLDIGVPSFRNLWSIRRSRVVMWVLLALSSLPLHFIYNSVISSSIPQYGYAAAVVSDDFLHGGQFGNNYVDNTNSVSDNWTYTFDNAWPPKDQWDMETALPSWQQDANDTTIFANLTTVECLRLYTNVYARRTNLIVVTENFPGDFNASVHQYVYIPAVFSDFGQYFPCRNGDPTRPTLSCVPPETNPNVIRQWNKFNRTVLYCLSEVPPPGDHCRLNYSPSILIGKTL
jgi:hypothetical protein